MLENAGGWPDATATFIRLFQGRSLLMQLYLNVLRREVLSGSEATPGASAALGTLCSSAFLGEIWRGLHPGHPRGRWEASDARPRVACESSPRHPPQALRIAVPPTVGFLVQILKGTSLASIIGFTELTRAAQIVNNATFRPLIVYATVTLLYFALCWPLSWWSQRLERRLDHDRRPMVAAQA